MRCRVLLLAVALACFAFSPTARAVLPPPAPDGGYPGQNTAEGNNALRNLNYSPTSGNAQNNTAIGESALSQNSTGSSNTATGAGALSSNISGVSNTAAGTGALRGNPSGAGNSSYNSALGHAALFSNAGSYNTATGSAALNSNSTGDYNTASGAQALYSNSSGYNNTASGIVALYSNTTGVDNTAHGRSALSSNTIGTDNTAVGMNALSGNSTGSFNIALGVNAGSNLTTGSNNIVIGANVTGAAGDANKIRIGKSTHTATYIGGIYNKTVASGTGVGVMIDANGKLGTVVSSARFKEAIKPMEKASEAILALEPVTFRYKHELDPDGLPQFGLIAEQVEKVDANLVVRGEDGKVNTVRYEAVNAMLLNEFLKEHRKVEEQQATITRLASRLAKQELTGAQQQKQIETLTATVQKVSDQVALSKPASQLVANP